MNQPGFDWEAARAARDEGIARAAQHADDVTPKWSDRAFGMLSDYVKASDEAFTSEDVRVYAAGRELPEPPHLRAWGGVFQRAARQGLIVKDGHTTARAVHVHCSIVALWRAA